MLLSCVTTTRARSSTASIEDTLHGVVCALLEGSETAEHTRAHLRTLANRETPLLSGGLEIVQGVVSSLDTADRAAMRLVSRDTKSAADALEREQTRRELRAMFEAFPEGQRGQEDVWLRLENAAREEKSFVATLTRLATEMRAREAENERDGLDLYAVLHPDPEEANFDDPYDVSLDRDPKRLGQTKFGGFPHVPADVARRIEEAEIDPKALVVQIDFSWLCQYDVRGVVPMSGWLWIFETCFEESSRPKAIYWDGPRSELQPPAETSSKDGPGDGINLFFVEALSPRMPTGDVPAFLPRYDNLHSYEEHLDGDDEPIEIDDPEAFLGEHMFLFCMGGDGDCLRGATYEFAPFIKYADLAAGKLEEVYALSSEC